MLCVCVRKEVGSIYRACNSSFLFLGAVEGGSLLLRRCLRCLTRFSVHARCRRDVLGLYTALAAARRCRGLWCGRFGGRQDGIGGTHRGGSGASLGTLRVVRATAKGRSGAAPCCTTSAKDVCLKTSTKYVVAPRGRLCFPLL